MREGTNSSEVIPSRNISKHARTCREQRAVILRLLFPHGRAGPPLNIRDDVNRIYQNERRNSGNKINTWRNARRADHPCRVLDDTCVACLTRCHLSFRSTRDMNYNRPHPELVGIYGCVAGIYHTLLYLSAPQTGPDELTVDPIVVLLRALLIWQKQLESIAYSLDKMRQEDEKRQWPVVTFGNELYSNWCNFILAIFPVGRPFVGVIVAEMSVRRRRVVFGGVRWGGIALFPLQPTSRRKSQRFVAARLGTARCDAVQHCSPGALHDTKRPPAAVRRRAAAKSVPMAISRLTVLLRAASAR